MSTSQRSRTTLILDLESNGFLPMVDTIWIVCTKVVETGEVREFYSAEDLRAYIQDLKPTHVVFHNGIGYDLEVLRRVWGIPYTVGRECSWNEMPVKFVDTLLISRFLNADREGGHSLESFGERLGFPKGSHSDWSKLTPEMIAYCKQDVAVTERTLKMLETEMESCHDNPRKPVPTRPPVESSHRKPTGYQGEAETYTDPYRLPEYNR